ncbi:hypothetical protein ACFYRL_17690 [Streptomyces goshikiensis]|uniref:hypothetical protein n=1 Tax=Streptomyces goshikiensis TaxID=1942 RepID=UPI0036A15328
MYRLFGEDGALLYVGKAGSVDSRMRNHAASKAWWPEVHRFHSTPYATDKAAALIAEDEAIATENPMYNKDRRIRYRNEWGTVQPVPLDQTSEGRAARVGSPQARDVFPHILRGGVINYGNAVLVPVGMWDRMVAALAEKDTGR